jgi:hypothetical protein
VVRAGGDARTSPDDLQLQDRPGERGGRFLNDDAACLWSAVTCHRFCAGDLSPSNAPRLPLAQRLGR